MHKKTHFHLSYRMLLRLLLLTVIIFLGDILYFSGSFKDKREVDLEVEIFVFECASS